VRLARYAFFPVAEGRPAVVVPCHLEHAWMSGDAFDAQAWPERTVRGYQIRNEDLKNYLAEQVLLLRGELLPVPLKTGKRLERRHQASAAPSSSRWANMSSADSCDVPRPWVMSSSASRSPASH